MIAVLAGLATAGLAFAAPAPARAQAGQVTCNTMGADGRALPQPNIGFICGQIEAMRQDCANIEKNGYAQLFNHCFGFTRRDVTATGSISTRSQDKNAGGGR